MEKGISVLIIEDSQVQRAVIVNLVKELGYNPVTIEHFDENIAGKVKEELVSIVLLDLMLQDEDGAHVLDGFQLCYDIKESNPDVRVVVVSAESDDAAREFALLHGADGFLAKPFKIDELERCLSEI